MKLEKISINNFRCFDQYDIDFAKEFTILIGKNGVGKSTVISAVKRALSFMFSKSSKQNGVVNQLSSSNSLNTLKFNPLDARFDYNQIDYVFPINITAQASFCHQTIEWAMLKSKMKGKISSSMFTDALERFTQLRTDEDIWPILAYFSDSYPHQETSIMKEVSRILSSGKPVPRNFGYYQWNNYTSCANLWQQKFINSWYKYQDAKQSFEIYTKNVTSNIEYKNIIDENFFKSDPAEMEAIHNKLQTIEEGAFKFDPAKMEAILNRLQTIEEGAFKFDPAKMEAISSKFMEAISSKFNDYNTIRINIINEFNYIKNILFAFFNIGGHDNEIELLDIDVERRSDKEKYMQFTFKDGRKVIFEELPAGYKRLVSMVLDIAYRSFILTKGERTKETGIVLIDEIDLHLHPSLEQNVVQRFKHAFPNIQFIVTTHSALVISNFQQDENNKVIRLSFDDNKYESTVLDSVYGLDYNTSVSAIMGTPMRNTTVEYLKEAYIRLIRRGKEEQAEEALAKLKEELKGAFPEIEEEIKKRLSE